MSRKFIFPRTAQSHYSELDQNQGRHKLYEDTRGSLLIWGEMFVQLKLIPRPSDRLLSQVSVLQNIQLIKKVRRWEIWETERDLRRTIKYRSAKTWNCSKEWRKISPKQFRKLHMFQTLNIQILFLLFIGILCSTLKGWQFVKIEMMHHHQLKAWGP